MYKLTIYREKPSTYKDSYSVITDHCALMSMREYTNKVVVFLALSPSDDVVSYLGLLLRADIIDGFKLKKME